MDYARASDLNYARQRLLELAQRGQLRPAEAQALAQLEGMAPAISGTMDDTRQRYSDAGQGVMDAAIWVNQNFNPVELIGQSMQASRRMLAPGRSGWERVSDGADMLTNLVEGGGALFGPVVGAINRGVAAIPEAAATLSRGGGYRVGEALRAAGDGASYIPATNKPGLLALPGYDTKFEARPVSAIEEAAMEYMRGRGERDFRPLTEYPQFSDERARAIALAYADMAHDPSNPLVRRAYDAMIDETLAQYNALRDTGIDFRFLRDGMDDPYAASPGLGYKDMVENGRLYVFPTDFGFGSSSGFDPSTNPLLRRVGRIGDKSDAVANDAFRVVHDAFGHYGPGNPFFRHQGEERAWVEHSRMFSPEARGAMTSETRGQNSWLNFGPYGAQNRSALGADTVFADQKTGLMPDWTWGLLSPDDERAAIEDFLRRRGR
jgi:hypothetical protein